MFSQLHPAPFFWMAKLVNQPEEDWQGKKKVFTFTKEKTL
jgi:hypothetical protein